MSKRENKHREIRRAYQAATIYTPGGSKITPRISRIAKAFNTTPETVNRAIAKL
jgi:Mn-dependent DtxR family transcriptional regulator